MVRVSVTRLLPGSGSGLGLVTKAGAPCRPSLDSRPHACGADAVQMQCICSAHAGAHASAHAVCEARAQAPLALREGGPRCGSVSALVSALVSVSLAACLSLFVSRCLPLSLLLSLSISLSLLLSLPPCLPTYLPACLCAPEAPNPFANQGGAQHVDRRRRQVSQVKVLLRHHTRRRRQVSCHTVRLRPGRHRRRYRRQRRRRRRGRRGRRLAMRRPLFCLWRARHLLSPRWWSRLCVLGVWCGLQLGLTILVE